MTRLAATLLLPAALCTLAACATEQRAWTRTDPWFHPPEQGNDIVRRAGTPVPWAEVRPGARLQAAALLESQQIVELTPQQRAQFLDAPLGDPGAKLFLVRAVYVNWDTGHFSVLTDGRDLLVFHRSIARTTGQMGRWPLVVALPEKPANIYILAVLEN
jgi:hypothetical protein